MKLISASNVLALDRFRLRKTQLYSVFDVDGIE